MPTEAETTLVNELVHPIIEEDIQQPRPNVQGESSSKKGRRSGMSGWKP